MNKLIKHPIWIAISICLLLTQHIFAHDGSEHVSDAEAWVAGIGIVLIMLSILYTLISQRKHTASKLHHKPKSND